MPGSPTVASTLTGFVGEHRIWLQDCHLYAGSNHDDSAVAADSAAEHAAVQTGVSMSRRRWLTAMPARKKYTASSTCARAHDSEACRTLVTVTQAAVGIL